MASNKVIRLNRRYDSHYDIVDNFKRCRVCKSKMDPNDWDGGIDPFIQCNKCHTLYKIVTSGYYLVKYEANKER